MATSNSNDSCGCLAGIKDLLNAPLDESGMPIVLKPFNRSSNPQRVREPGGTLRTAFNLGRFSAQRTVNKTDVTSTRDSDLYRASFTRNGQVSLRVTNLTLGRPIRLSILDSQGRIARDSLGNPLTTQFGSGTAALTQAVPGGTYYLKLVGLRQASSSYRISLSFR